MTRITKYCLVASALIVLTAPLCVFSDMPTPLDDFTIEPETDTTVRLSWVVCPWGGYCNPNTGFEGDSFSVYFGPTDAFWWWDTCAPVARTDTSACVHDPDGATGYYVVGVWSGDDEEIDSEFVVSSRPGHTDRLVVYELDSSRASGYGWGRKYGTASRYEMTDTGNAGVVDFYVTDFQTGTQGPTYYIASPDTGPTDPGAEVPAAEWRRTTFCGPLADELAPLPRWDSASYVTCIAIDSTLPFLVGCHTADGYYALIEVDSIDLDGGYVRLESWFQTLHGVRLIDH